MLEALKEHLEEVAVEVVLKRALPSLIVTYSALLAKELHWPGGQPLFSQKSVHALVALAVVGSHYAVHIWFKLKARDAAIRAAQAQDKKGGH